jgi:DNA-binding MarR family transcriptional regulator
MTRTVNCLVDLGLVAKAPHPTDGRQVVVTLTESGKAEVEETRRRRNTWLAAQLEAMTGEERQLLTDATELLRRIAQA